MLMPCKECRLEISTTAEVCPHCGFQQGAWLRKIRKEINEQEEYENSKEYKDIIDKRARSEGFKNAEAKEISEHKEWERKEKREEKIKWMKDVMYTIVGASLILGPILLILRLAYIVIFGG